MLDRPERLVSVSGGYQLLVEPRELDSLEFENLAAEGAGALARGDHDVAVAMLDRALSLWHGPALAGTHTGPVTGTVLTGLEERRANAGEDYFAARLARPDIGSDLIARLREHVVAYPLREHAWAQLMTALYRWGDPSAALAAFTDARRVLDAELGIPPGRELVDLQQAILERDARLLRTPAREPAVVTGPMAVPCELPRGPKILVGRTTELKIIADELLSCTHGPVEISLYGPVGAGASALAIQAAQLAVDRFRDGQLYVDMRASLGRAAGHLLRSFGIRAPTDRAEAAARVRSVLGNRRVLVVLDNVPAAEPVDELLPARGLSATIVTSRRMSSIHGVRLRVSAPSTDDAVKILGQVVGPARVRVEPDAAAEVVEYCDRLPLAVRVAGLHLVRRPDRTVAALARRLGRERFRLDELAAVRAGLAAAYGELVPGEALAFRGLGRVADSLITVGLVARLLGELGPTKSV
ncbi:MAG: BTAD domain-containing putative transcriptional regulator [Pseudonocardia sp.]